MLTAEKIGAKTPKERLELLDSFGRLAFGDVGQREMAEQIGYTRRTWANWRTRPETIPTAVILLLQEWALRGSKDAMALRTFAEISDSMEAISRKFSTLAELWTTES